MVTQKIGGREQLYMLEFLVNQLNLLPEIVARNHGALSVHFKFLDFDEFVINQEEFSKKVKDNGVDFGSGKSCIFSKKPKELLKKLQANPLIIEIYRSNSDPCPREPVDPICKSELHISGCFCEIEKAMNYPHKLPEPYTVRDTYNLLDENGKLSGSIEVFLRFSCLGESVVTHFHANETAFLFKNTNSLDEFSCIKLPPSAEELKKKFWTPKSRVIDPNKKPEAKTIIGISRICEDLIERSPAPKSQGKSVMSLGEDLQPPGVPEAPVIAQVENTEKTDSLIPKKSNFDIKNHLSPRKFPCGGRSCPGGICSGLPLSNQNIFLENQWKSDRKPPDIKNNRLRGGAEEKSATLSPDPRKNMKSFDRFSSKNKFQPTKSGIDVNKTPEDLTKCSSCRISPEIPPLILGEDIKSPGLSEIEGKLVTNNSVIREKSDIDISKYLTSRKFPCGERSCCGDELLHEENCIRNRWENYDKPKKMRNKRLRGGNDGRSVMIPIQSMQTLLSGVCRSFVPEGEPHLGCGCHTKMGNQSKIKKKCYGIDCLIKSFREAEKFVDGIGKVPGMAGLGLMDPMESPFFGRPRYRPLPTVGDSKNPVKSYLGMPMMKKDSSILRAPWRSPLRHEDRNKINGSELKKLKREDHEKNTVEEIMTIKEPQMGPCGEPVCNSRRKINKTDLDVSSKETLKTIKIKRASLLSTKRKNMNLNLKRAKNLKNYERNYSHVKVGKRVMRMVEGVSQRSCFGHRSCVEIRARVPGNMGWLWNINNVSGNFRPRVGWKPGAISRGVWSALVRAKMEKDPDSIDQLPVTPVKGKKGKMSKTKSLLSVVRNQRKKREVENQHELPPTLHIHRKNGDYFVTMYPVKPEDSEHPEVLKDVKPLQFKVTKDRKTDDDEGDVSSVGDDMEFEFSPPAAIQKYQKKTEKKDLETQVIQQEILDAFKTTGSPVAKKKKGGKK
ncbi:uncharacterized protein [Fopius arisanus]|uniref:DUF4776 domain-containing protein n=1 Tax=Fopius arisanus TaxID=64838 RepID=A0A9R1TBP2_9HYME|nr:PREDICTED: uncharacterized protein LOC105268374 [Fopius arisanus]